ncbi:MAG: hypothetical protein FWD61_07220 [Phycisphaerales bacterium]|nr:hypothetical protein [Phycisphaerales bacterium]
MLGTNAGSFSRSAEALKRVGQLTISDEMLRVVVESEGRCVLRWQEQEREELAFDAGKCVTRSTSDGSTICRVYVGMDGFMLPMVTQAEADKRYQKARSRRKTLRKKRGRRRSRLVKPVGADQRYKEYKLAAFYDQDQRHKLLRVTRKGPEQVGKMLQVMSEHVQLFKAKQIVAVTDGAMWIDGLVKDCLPRDKTTAILDFYHAAEHVHQARREVYGESSPEGCTWAGEIVKGMREKRFDDWWQLVVDVRARVRSSGKRKALDGLMQYLLSRREKIDYAHFRAMGLKIGSGPTESGCKSESRRLKGVGMRWTSKNAEAMLALESLYQSNQWKTYWYSKYKAAA